MQVRKLALCAIFSALLCVSAWIAIPLGALSITAQTFALFLCLYLLGGKYATVSVWVYLALGAVGLPVFSGFQGGFGILLGPTGGYLFGFALAAMVYWLLTTLLGTSTHICILSMILGLLLCYTLGSLWYLQFYAGKHTLSLGAVFLQCVAPYLLPDALKLYLACTLGAKLRRHV